MQHPNMGGNNEDSKKYDKKVIRIRKELDKLTEINASLVMEVMQLVVKYEDTPLEDEFKYF